MTLTETTELNSTLMETLHRLWNSEYPERLRHASVTELQAYLTALDNKHHILLADEQREIQGWCFSFERDDATWFAIIVNSENQGKGYGRQLLNALKKKHTHLNGWVIDHHSDKKTNSQRYRSPLPFYLNSGFKTEPGTRLETEKISAVKIVWHKT
jgi:GNAT superfamily N-acetyltransferase